MKTFLLAVDFSDSTPQLVETVQRVVKLPEQRVIALHVVEPDPEFVGYDVGPVAYRAIVANDIEKERVELRKVVDDLAARGIKAEIMEAQGAVVETILKEAVKHQVDCIVMGSHGHGALYDFFLGSTSQGVLKSAPCSVLVVPTPKKQS